MTFYLSYASRRSEVWWAYAKGWKAGLWKFHLFFVLLNAVTFPLLTGTLASPVAWLEGVTLGLLPCVMMALWPQIMFKPQTRAIRFNDQGFTTEISSHSGKQDWGEIEKIEQIGDLILIVGKSKNMMVVPDRAFRSSAERAIFLQTIQSWLMSVGID